MVAGSLALLGLSDLPYPPGLLWYCTSLPPFLTRGAHVCFALHRSLGALTRGVERDGWECEKERNGTK